MKYCELNNTKCLQFCGEAATARSRERKPMETSTKEHVSREAAAAGAIAIAASRLGLLSLLFCGLAPAAMCCRRFATHIAEFTRLRFVLVCFIYTFFCTHAWAETDKPNIVLFLVDDMGLMDTSVPMLTDENGKPRRYAWNEWYRTPSMERLAALGTRFSNFYSHNVCSPTRVSIMTGQNSARHRCTDYINPWQNNRTINNKAYPLAVCQQVPPEWNWAGLKKQDVTLPKLLRQVGYTTIHVGKAHFAPFKHVGEDPLNLGFDINIGGSSIGRNIGRRCWRCIGSLRRRCSRWFFGSRRRYWSTSILSNCKRSDQKASH